MTLMNNSTQAGWCTKIIYHNLICFGNSNNQTVLSESERQPGGWCIQSGTAALTLFQVLGSIVLLWYTRRQQRQRQGTSKLLPIYQVYIRLLMVITVLVSLIQLIDSVGFIVRQKHQPTSAGNIKAFVSVGFTWASYHILFEGIVFLLLSRTLGSKTIRRVQILSTFWFCVTFGLVGGAAFLGQQNTERWKDWFGLGLFEIWNISLFIFYLVVGFVPDKYIIRCCFRRPAAKTFAIFFATVRGGNLLGDIMTIMYQAKANAASTTLFEFGNCLNYAVTGVLFTVLVPIVVYFALLEDSKYWRGEISSGTSSFFGATPRSTTEIQPSTSDIRQPLIGLSYTSGEIAAVQNEMETVPEHLLIDFHELSLNMMTVLGVGGTARVYRGNFRNQPVAIKMLICPEISQELVGTFFREAITLNVLSKSHPNIVDVNGICVAPPALCIVLELCAGSLFDIWQNDKDLHVRKLSVEKIRTQRGPLTVMNNKNGRSSSSSALSSTSGLLSSFLHNQTDRSASCDQETKQSFSSYYSDHSDTETDHRPRSFSSSNLQVQIKPFSETKQKNTNIISNRNLKLMKFLESAIQCVRPVSYLHQLFPPRCHRDIKSLNYLVAASIAPYRKMAGLGPEIKLADMETVSTSEDSIRDEHSIAPVVYTPQWAAPEVMQPIMLKEIQPPFQPPSDVYSLTMVLYECLTQKVPFGDQDQFAQIDQLVVNEGFRPHLPLWIPSVLKDLFEIGWNQDYKKRCTAQNMLDRLIEMYHLCGDKGEELYKYQIAVNHATLLLQGCNNLVKDRKYRGTIYKSCCVNTELIDFILTNSLLFMEKQKNKNTNDTNDTGVETKDLDWETLSMTKKQAIKILDNLIDRHLMQHVTGEHKFVADGLYYYKLFPSIIHRINPLGERWR